MKPYIGTKIISAEPEVKGDQEGYKVVYHDGYVSWSLKPRLKKLIARSMKAKPILLRADNPCHM